MDAEKSALAREVDTGHGRLDSSSIAKLYERAGPLELEPGYEIGYYREGCADELRHSLFLEFEGAGAGHRDIARFPGAGTHVCWVRACGDPPGTFAQAAGAGQPS